MDFDEFWDKHGNANGDDTTLAMIRKYGIESVRLIAHNAWLFAQCTVSQPTVQADAGCHACTDWQMNSVYRFCPNCGNNIRMLESEEIMDEKYNVLSKMETSYILNKLRNPYGLNNDDLRTVRLAAADKIETLEDAYANLRDWIKKEGIDFSTHGE